MPAQVRLSHRRVQGKPVRETWLEDSLGDGWRIAYRLVPQAGLPVIGEIRVYPDEPERRGDAGEWSAHELGDTASVPAGGLPIRALRRISLEDAQRNFHEIFRSVHEQYPDDPLWVLETWSVDPAILSRQLSRHPGRGGRSDAFYAQLAFLYTSTVQTGQPRPLEHLAKELARPSGHVRQLLATARERGLLTRSTRGRAGGELTEKARRTLQAHQLGVEAGRGVAPND